MPRSRRSDTLVCLQRQRMPTQCPASVGLALVLENDETGACESEDIKTLNDAQAILIKKQPVLGTSASSLSALSPSRPSSVASTLSAAARKAVSSQQRSGFSTSPTSFSGAGPCSDGPCSLSPSSSAASADATQRSDPEGYCAVSTATTGAVIDPEISIGLGLPCSSLTRISFSSHSCSSAACWSCAGWGALSGGCSLRWGLRYALWKAWR
eukprot:3724010-Rhodomonas_salina.2